MTGDNKSSPPLPQDNGENDANALARIIKHLKDQLKDLNRKDPKRRETVQKIKKFEGMLQRRK